jgi:YVTN family beta-propeller protein
MTDSVGTVTFPAYLASRGKSKPIVATNNSVAVIDPSRNKLVDDLPVGDRPTRIVSGAGSVWALNEGARTVSEIDPASHNVRTFAIGVVPDDIAVGNGRLWVGESTTGTLDEIDPGSGQTLHTVKPRFPPGVAPFKANLALAGNVAFDHGDVWFAAGSGTLARVDAQTLHVKHVVTGLESANDGQIVATPRAVWLHDSYGAVSHIDPATNRSVGRVNINLHSTGGLTVTPDGNVWVTDTSQGVLWEIDGNMSSIVTSHPVGTNPFGVAYGAGSLWVANNGDGTVTRLDPATGRATTIPVGAGPLRVAFAAGKVWVTVD